MDITSILFYVFAAILIASSLKVITAKNPVHAVLFLVLAFVTASCLWMMLGAEFLSLTLILVYVGAVMVLFLFVVMMLDIDIETLRRGFWKNLPLALLLGVIVAVEMIFVIVRHPLGNIVIHSDPETTLSNSNVLGWVLYTQYSYPVELASLILLLGLVVAVALTLRESDKSDKAAKYQDIGAQVSVQSKDRFAMVKMDAEVESKEGEQQ